MEFFKMFEKSESREVITLEVTVASGFESLAMSEINKKVKVVFDICKARGRVFFSTEECCIGEVLKLRSIDHVYLVACVQEDMDFSVDKAVALTMLEKLIKKAHWKNVIQAWTCASSFKGICFPSKEEYAAARLKELSIKQEVTRITGRKAVLLRAAMRMAEARPVESTSDGASGSGCYKEKRNELKQNIIYKEDQKAFYESTDERGEEEKVLKFRTTCNRTGKHNFTSPEVACCVGGKLQEKFNWIVDLVYYDLEVVINVKENRAYITVSLTKESLHRRNILKFGPTTLRATVCYNLLQLVSPSCGDIILDPLCGGGSIPIEGAVAFNRCYNIGGDNHPLAISRAYENVQFMKPELRGYIDLVRWDVTRLPLRDACIDMFVTDLPFGKRSGSKENNQVLYQKAVLEIARCIVPEGCVVFLTWDKTNLIRTLRRYSALWSITKIAAINLGGLKATAYVVKRTPECLNTFLAKLKQKGKLK